MARRCWELQVKVGGGFGSPAVGTDIGPATPAGPEGIRFVVALHYQSTEGIAGIARPWAWPAGVEHPDRKRRERERRSGTLWVSSPRGAGNRFKAAFFPVSGIRELSGAGLSQVGPSARLSCAWPITPHSFSPIGDSTTPSGVAIGESAHFGLELFLFSNGVAGRVLVVRAWIGGDGHRRDGGGGALGQYIPGVHQAD